MIAHVLTKTKAKLKSNLPEGVSAKLIDIWYMDDGQIFCDPMLVDPFLTLLDEELRQVGATRGSTTNGDEIKSIARIVGDSDKIAKLGSSWITSHVRSTCKLPPAGSTAHVLGIDFGTPTAAADQFLEITKKIEDIHSHLSTIGDCAIELALLRNCASTCKIVHLCRASAPVIPAEILERLDASMRKALDMTLGSNLNEDARAQATTGVKDGGLGLRRAVDLALPVFIVSFALLPSR